jgi:hypothetical protein
MKYCPDNAPPGSQIRAPLVRDNVLSSVARGVLMCCDVPKTAGILLASRY